MATDIRPLIGGCGGVYFLAQPGELVVEVVKRDRNAKKTTTDLRALLIGPDRTVLQEATIPDDGNPVGSGLGPARYVRLSTRVDRPGVYSLNVTVSQDRYGTEIFLPDAARNVTVAALCERGLADRMVLSQDACATIDWFPEELIDQLAPNWHFTHLFETILPQLAELGVSDADVATMLDETPSRWLAA